MKTLKTILQEVISGIKAWVDANVVHKSGTETIDGTKAFSAPQCYSSNYILFNSSVLPTQNTVPSGNINPLRQYVGYGASYANSVFIHDTEMRSNGRNHYRWTIYSSDHSANMGMWLVYNPDSEYLRYLDLKGSFVPDSDGTYHLGIPTQRWKTINGVNPGALSLPNSPGGTGTENVNYFDLSGNISVRDGSVANSFTANCDGWIAIGAFATWLQISNDTLILAITANPGSDGFAQAFLPVRQGNAIRVMINQTNTTFQSFKLLPCEGNV